MKKKLILTNKILFLGEKIIPYVLTVSDSRGTLCGHAPSPCPFKDKLGKDSIKASAKGGCMHYMFLLFPLPKLLFPRPGYCIGCSYWGI